MKQLISIILFFSSSFSYAQNVGIGTTTPDEKLQVDSVIRIGKNAIINAGSTRKNTIKFGDGNFATIGEQDKDDRLVLNAASFSFKTGSVGIGLDSATEKLDINGDVKADTIINKALKMATNAGAGKVMTSDAVGNATWQEKSSNGSVGFGTWGDCSTNNISEYNPIADTTFQANNATFFGSEVAISGNYAIVGAKQDKIGPNLRQGSASIYQFTNGIWTLMQKITDVGGIANDEFGSSVAIAGNYAVIGSPNRDIGTNNSQGSVSVYVLSGGTWVFSQRLTDPGGVAINQFGSSVSISGNYIIVGAPSCCNSNVTGNACIYQLLAGSYIFMQKITDASGAANDLFGSSVSISGNNAIVGSPKFNSSAGAACIFKLSGSWTLANKFTGFTAGDEFGTSVSISGNCALVGVPGDDNNPTLNVGEVETYQFINNTWVLAQPIRSTDIVGANAGFGTKLFLSGNYAIIATNWNIGENLRSVTIFQRFGFVWQKVQYIKNPVSTSFVENAFGSAISIDAGTKRFLIGAVYGADSPLGNGTVTFGKLNF